MNEPMSILLATTILALGGLGLYLYKSSDDNTKVEKDEDEYNEDTLFGGSFWGSSDDKEKDDSETDIYEEEFKPRKRGNKTQRNRKTSGTSRRRY